MPRISVVHGATEIVSASKTATKPGVVVVDGDDDEPEGRDGNLV